VLFIQKTKEESMKLMWAIVTIFLIVTGLVFAGKDNSEKEVSFGILSGFLGVLSLLIGLILIQLGYLE
jgi:uncharacterized membrane protein